MARRPQRPGRTLLTFFVGLLVAYGLVAINGVWTPGLGLDLQGGTSITLQATNDPEEESLEEARQIIDDRVNGSGVAEADVTTQGGDQIVVEVPGANARNLIDTVKRTAQLRFRVVACSTADGRCGSGAAGQADDLLSQLEQTTPQQGNGNGNGGNNSGNDSGNGDGGADSGAESGNDGAGSGSNNRPAVGFGVKTQETEEAQPTEEPSEEPSESATAEPTDAASEGAGNGNGNGNGEDQQSAYDRCVSAAADDETSDTPLEWMDNPTTACVNAFAEYAQSGTCQPGGATDAVMTDTSDAPLITCDENGIAYLLSDALIEGTELDDAQAQIPQNQLGYVVTLSFNGDATRTFGQISSELLDTGEQFAIVLDGQVLSAPTMDGLILDGNAQISGDFNETSANSLATSLRYGSLPIEFGDDPLVETIGPTLAGDQLSAGLTAGLIGLLIVMFYCLVYYRGLGTVVIASLVVAAALTYALVLLLSETAGFTLTLPGIAGLIVAVGITADSFIVLFERIRDEMRSGKSMRVAVEAGWKRARNTCLAADTVSLLAAVVLYIFAAGVVKGFAFALGLTTLIDLVVFFWFTKPMVSWLATFTFFNKGHAMSGLNASTLGVDKINVETARGTA